MLPIYMYVFHYDTGNVSEAARSMPALTALPRNEWAKIRNTNFRSGINRESMKAIQVHIAYFHKKCSE